MGGLAPVAARTLLPERVASARARRTGHNAVTNTIISRGEPMPHRTDLLRRRVLQAGAAALTARYVPLAVAADPFRIGLILPLSGPFASTGKQVEAACRLYMQKNGDTVAGRKVELIVRDDTGVAPETTKRTAQELIVRNQVNILAGFGLTPLALATAPVATE